MDKRQHIRVNITRPVIVRLSKGQSIHATLVNLSSHGVGFVFKVPAEIGAVFRLKFSLPIQHHIREFDLAAKVVHTRISHNEHYTGLEFINPPSDQIALIQNFVTEKAAGKQAPSAH